MTILYFFLKVTLSINCGLSSCCTGTNFKRIIQRKWCNWITTHHPCFVWFVSLSLFVLLCWLWCFLKLSCPKHCPVTTFRGQGASMAQQDPCWIDLQSLLESSILYWLLRTSSANTVSVSAAEVKTYSCCSFCFVWSGKLKCIFKKKRILNN